MTRFTEEDREKALKLFYDIQSDDEVYSTRIISESLARERAATLELEEVKGLVEAAEMTEEWLQFHSFSLQSKPLTRVLGAFQKLKESLK